MSNGRLEILRPNDTINLLSMIEKFEYTNVGKDHVVTRPDVFLNKQLRDGYYQKRNALRQSGKLANEIILFHGTKEENMISYIMLLLV